MGLFDFKLPTLDELFKDPVGALGDVTHLGTLGTSILLAPNPLVGGLGTILTDREKARNKERADAYNAAVGTEGLDAITKKEIEDLYRGGGSAAEIGKLLAAAKENKGVYFSRTKNEAQMQLMKERPGRSQTVLSSGPSTILGGGRGY